MTHYIAYVQVDGSTETDAVDAAAAIMDENVGDKRAGYPFDGAQFADRSNRYDVPTTRRTADVPAELPDAAEYFFDEGEEWVVAFDVHR